MSDADPKPAPAAEPATAAQGQSGEGKAAGAGDIHAYIGTRLREVYNDVASQPVPERFLDLMRQLEGK